MPRLFLVRHAHHALLGRELVGQRSGVPLSEQGREEAEGVAARLAGEGVGVVWSSPLERTRETAQAIAGRLGLEVRMSDALLEVHFGQWTGRSFDDLRDDALWRAWNAVRSTARPPQGEMMVEVQARMVGFLVGMGDAASPDAVVVSHGDPIRAALVHFLGMPLDLLTRIEVTPASDSLVVLEDGVPRVGWINRTSSVSDIGPR